MRCEMKATVRALGLVRKQGIYAGRYGDSEIVAGVMGVGGVRAGGEAERLIVRYKPGRIILIGYSGALDPSLVSGKLIRPRCVVNENGQVIELHDDGPPRVGEAGECGGGCLLTVDRGVSGVDEKRCLFEKYGAVAVDMESYAIGQVAMSQGIPLLIRRAISDEAFSQLPSKIFSWVSFEGEARPGRVFADLLTNPQLLAVMLRLASLSRRGSKALAGEVLELIG